MSKTHYAFLRKANENDSFEYWSETACNLQEHESPCTNDWKLVTCKKCLRKKKMWDYCDTQPKDAYHF